MSSVSLWVLVENMTAEERRFFRRDYFSAEKGVLPPLYIRLFDVICKQACYNEELIIKALHPDLNKKNISYTKGYLYNELCNSLLAFAKEKDIYAIISKDICLIRLLREKGVFLQALKIWSKSIQQARAHELFPLVLQLKEEYHKMLLYNDPKASYPTLIDEYYNNKLFLEDYIHFLKLQEAHLSALLLRKRSHFKLKKEEMVKVDELLSGKALAALPATNSFLFSHYFNSTKAILLFLKNDSASFTYALKNLKSWNDNVTFISNNLDDYLEVIYTYYYSAVLMDDLSELENFINFANDFFQIDDVHKAYFNTLKYLSFNRLNNRKGDYSKVEEVIKVMKAQIEHWAKFVNVELIRSAYLSISIASFALEDYDDAYYYTKKVFAMFNDQTRTEHYSFAYLFLLIICFEKKESYLFEIQYNSSYNYFYRNKRPLTFEKEILSVAYKAFYLQSNCERKQIFEDLIHRLYKSKNDIIQAQVFNIFNFPRWFHSKVGGYKYKDWRLQEAN